jgi:hypothetical protein
MRVVLTDPWENGRRVSSPGKSLYRAMCQAHKMPKTRLESVTGKGDRSSRKLSFDPVREGRGKGRTKLAERRGWCVAAAGASANEKLWAMLLASLPERNKWKMANGRQRPEGRQVLRGRLAFLYVLSLYRSGVQQNGSGLQNSFPTLHIHKHTCQPAFLSAGERSLPSERSETTKRNLPAPERSRVSRY